MFFGIFSGFHSGLHFYSLFGDFMGAKAPVLELVGLIFDIEKRIEKGCASVCEYTRVYASIGGRVPLKQDNSPPGGSFSTSVHSSSA